MHTTPINTMSNLCSINVPVFKTNSGSSQQVNKTIIKKTLKDYRLSYNSGLTDVIGNDYKTYTGLEDDNKNPLLERTSGARVHDPLGIYMNELSKSDYDTLKLEKEYEYVQDYYNNKNEKAGEKLIKSNLRYVVTVAKKFRGRGVALVDLIQNGNLGLIRALQTYDYTRGFRFLSYAVNWVEAYIRHALYNTSSTVRVPVSVHNLMSDVKCVAAELSVELNRAPTVHEIADELNVDVKNVNLAIKSANPIISMEDQVSAKEDSKRVIDFIPADDSNFEQDLHKKDINSYIAKAIGHLTKDEQDVIKMKFGFTDDIFQTYDTIALRLGISAYKVKKLQRSALKKLKQELGKELSIVI